MVSLNAMAVEHKPKRPLVVYCIVLLELYLAGHNLFFVTKASSVFRPGVDLATACEDARHLLTPPDDVSSCMSHGLDEAKADVLFNGVIKIGFAVFFAVTSIGLWQLQRWARNLLAGACFVQLAFCARWLLFAKVAGWHTSRDPAPGFVVPQMAVELALLMALFSSGVPEAFGEIERG